MKNYRLLRSNKESGPYSVEELISLGLKAYDLIWIDGRSAAWRYPSELEELKNFAPPAEEQPFDRFYKKVKTPDFTENKIDEKAPVIQIQKQKPKIKITANSRKIKTKKTTVPTAEIIHKPVTENTELPWQDAWLDWEQEKKAASGIINRKNNNTHGNISEPVLETKYTASLDDIKSQYIENVLHAKNKSNKIQINISPSRIMAAVALTVVLAAGFWMGAEWTNNPGANISSAHKVSQAVENEPAGALSNEAENNLPGAAEAEKNVVQKTDDPVTFITVTKKDRQSAKSNTISKKADLPPDNTQQEENNSIADISVDADARPVHKRGEENVLPVRKDTEEKTVNDYIKLPSSIQLGSDGADVKISNTSDVLFDLVAIDLMYYDANNQYKKGETMYIKNLQPGKSMVVKAPGDHASVTIKPRISIISSDSKNIYLSGE